MTKRGYHHGNLRHALVEAALAFAFDVLEDGGTFVAKVLAGGAENEMQAMLKRNFTKVANRITIKVNASQSVNEGMENLVSFTGAEDEGLPLEIKLRSIIQIRKRS